MENKKIFSKIWLTTLILLNIMVVPDVSLALGPECKGSPTSDQCCADLADPAKTKEWIVTILEEQLGGKSSNTFNDPELIIMDCMRVTTVDTSGGSQEGGVSKSKSTFTGLKKCPADAKCDRVQVLLAKTGTALLYGYIGFIYRWAAATVGMVCVGMLVFYGIQIAASGGDSNKISEAKEHIMQSIGGLILLFLSSVILYTINPNFFVAT